MATTENLFTGDGSTTNYSFTFEYIDRSDVKADVAGVTTTDFTFANATTLSFDTAPDDGAEVRIYRDTDLDTLKATFFAGSAIKAEDLNNNFTQNNFAVQEVKNNTWDSDLQTIKSNETWVSNDDQIATTAAMDARFQDEVNETLTKAELAALSDVIPDDDVAVPTTGAVKDYVDHVVETDILVDGTGLNKTASGGQVTIGISANSVDFDRIKNDDIITQAEQDAGSPSPADSNIFTASAAARRFDTIVQTSTPSGSDWEVGKTWLQNDDDKTLYMWNGTSWLPVVSGGTFTELSKVIYVDSINGDDTLTGHRISNPKKTIKAAVDDINADSNGDGSVVVVAPGIYGETFPIDIEKNDIAIVGTSLRNCIIHPAIPAADQAGYDVTVPEANELTTMFRVNSGSYFYGLTLTGMKASGARGGNSLDTDATYGLPTNQGWNFAFYPNAQIKKSPYIQNCTNFSDSKVNNVNFTPHTPGEGSAGDLTSSPTGGGILVNGATVASNSPLRSMVADSYTHTALDGPGVFVTNNGYTQITSSYAFFNHYHIKCLNGGQANLAASTTDFGRYGLLVDGRSTSAIFTATTTATASDGDVTFTIGAPTADASWHGSATRPQGNMLVDIGGNTYPILSATANGSGWDVTISRPNPNKRDENLGLDGAVSSGAAVSFYLRSMIASSGHTMEYVGSGTDYTALPENGGVPIEANQVVELNNGKVWTATTDHNGKFKVGDFFTVDQRTGFVTVPVGSISFPVLAEDLDVNGHNIFDSTGNVKINDAVVLPSGSASAPTIAFTGDIDTGIYSPGANQVAISTGGTGRLFVDSSGNVGIRRSAPDNDLSIGSTGSLAQDANSFYIGSNFTGTGANFIGSSKHAQRLFFNNASSNGYLSYSNTGTAGTAGNPITWQERFRITSDGKLGLGTGTVDQLLHLRASAPKLKIEGTGTSDEVGIHFAANANNWLVRADNFTGQNTFSIKSGTPDSSTHRLLINASGNVGIGTASPSQLLHLSASSALQILLERTGAAPSNAAIKNEGQLLELSQNTDGIAFKTGTTPSERARIDSSGRLLVGTSSLRTTGWTTQSSGEIFQELTNYGGITIFTNANSAEGTTLTLGKSRGTTAGSNTLVSNNDRLASLIFQGADGTNTETAAAIHCYVDGTPGANDMPGRLLFSTTADGASSPTERMRITNGGLLKATTSTQTNRYTNAINHAIVSDSNNNWIAALNHTAAGPYGLVIEYTTATPNGTGNAFFECADNTATRCTIRSNGGIANYQSNDSNLCDEREKKNIETLDSTWNCLKEWELKKFHYNEDDDADEKRYGVIAQQVAEYCPEVITDWTKQKAEDAVLDEEGNVVTPAKEEIVRMGVKEQQMMWMAIKALQEAQTRIEALEAEVAALKGA